MEIKRRICISGELKSLLTIWSPRHLLQSSCVLNCTYKTRHYTLRCKGEARKQWPCRCVERNLTLAEENWCWHAPEAWQKACFYQQKIGDGHQLRKRYHPVGTGVSINVMGSDVRIYGWVSDYSKISKVTVDSTASSPFSIHVMGALEMGLNIIYWLQKVEWF